ncbi:MAG: DNA methyltransferase [Parvularcula sp.]|nr:DNA methyltransferase [Parvularcula sp.]
MAALQQLGVGLKEVDAHLSEAEKDLRRRLRAHGRQLGDVRKPDGTQEMARLTEEVAYEHWHRMLFARFLAENDLLMYPDPDAPVAVSLEECEEMAADEGARNGWELAAQYASKMLPQIFRPDSPSFELELPPEYQRKQENLLAELSAEVFQASDSLGWVYQFWQAKRKDEVNASEVKIGARELPAVTQLFTEPYMVSFLLDNSLGAWWAARRLSESDLKTAQTEEELRQKAGLPGVPLEYLRFVRDEASGAWAPAAGTFEGWPEDLGELKTLDPCCGSGHFLVAAFLMLVPMRMEREGLSARDAVDAVLRDNLHGLEIDPRCVEIAAFALALTAWRFPGAGGYRPLPELQVACSGLSISVTKEEWKLLAGLAADAFEGKRQADLFEDEDSELWRTRLTGAMESLYTLFSNAPVLGSIIDPTRLERELFVSDYSEGGSLFSQFADFARTAEQREMGVVAQGLGQASFLLSCRYDLVITNVPYLGREGHAESLCAYADTYYPDASGDLATIMLERSIEFTGAGGSCFLVLPQNWWVGRSYSRFREALVKNRTILLAVTLGEEAWETFGNRGPNTILLGATGSRPKSLSRFSAIDLSSKPNCPIVTRSAKRLGLRGQTREGLGEVISVSQENQLNNPDIRISLAPISSSTLLNRFVVSGEGCSTGDADRFLKFHFELKWGQPWIPYLTPDGSSNPWGGRELVMLWESGRGELASSPQARIQNTDLWSRKGVLVGRVRGISTTLFDGGAYSKGAVLICPNNPDYFAKVYGFLRSKEYESQVRALDPRVSASTSVLTKIGFSPERSESEELPPKTTDDPTQWIFHGHPAGSEAPLQVAVARLLGYQWPAELDAAMELSDEARAKVRQADALLPFADEDGIVCIPAVRGEASAADRLLNLLVAAYGDACLCDGRQAWSNTTLGQLLAQADHAGKPLETWLRDKFFAQHCKRFSHRPFIWHIWDGLRDGFAALVNYHKFDAKALETLIYTYLGDWITRQKEDIRNGVDGAQEKLAAAENLKKRLELIQQGEPPYDIFVRWKPLKEQPLGWHPDLNDGVRLNIRPFMTAEVLRENKKPKLNIHWNKDRGKDVASAPWFHLFGGDRINDHHLTRAEKEAARKEKSL